MVNEAEQLINTKQVTDSDLFLVAKCCTQNEKGCILLMAKDGYCSQQERMTERSRSERPQEQRWPSELLPHRRPNELLPQVFNKVSGANPPSMLTINRNQPIIQPIEY